MSLLHLVAVQLDIAWEDKAANFARVRHLLDGEPASLLGERLIVLPEMFSTGFSMNLRATRQDSRREDERFLADLACDYRATVVAGIVSPATGEMGRNEAVAFSPSGALLARYAKIHPFALGGEADGHERGDDIVAFACGRFKVTPLVCYDLRFPELFRAAMRRGANLFLVIALWPVKRQHHWLTLLQARAIENQAYVVGVNRVGAEPNYSYAGRTVVVDPHGFIIADAGEQERVLTATLDPNVVEEWRRDFPALRDAHWHDPSDARNLR